MNDGVVRIGVEDGNLAPGEDFQQTLRNLSVERFESVVAETTYPAKFKVLSTTWLTCFKINERRAEHFVHKNRIFLAGDAAHIHSPAGGQGLNTGLQDAHNLAWKLGYVLNGLAKPEFLLPTYEERGAMADRAIRLSSKLMNRNRKRGFVADIKAYLFFLIGPLVAKWAGSVFFSSEVAMVSYIGFLFRLSTCSSLVFFFWIAQIDPILALFTFMQTMKTLLLAGCQVREEQC
jgi:hypothetical protein